MKSLITFATMMLSVMLLQAQEKEISTYSVLIDDFINFIANKYEYQSPEVENEKNRNIVFLIQVTSADMAVEHQIVLEQGFKLLSERLNDSNTISILTYSAYNGIALDSKLPSNLDKINSVIKNPKEYINDFQNDGIELAYSHIKNNYVDEASNSIVIVRNPLNAGMNQVNLTEKKIKKIKRKKKKKEILKVAVSILPELLAIIKN